MIAQSNIIINPDIVRLSSSNDSVKFFDIIADPWIVRTQSTFTYLSIRVGEESVITGKGIRKVFAVMPQCAQHIDTSCIAMLA